MKKAFAWLVHLFTASGLLAGFMGLLAAVAGDYRTAMWWMLATLVIDGIDGTFARLAHVSEVLPHVSGQMIDYVIDFFTYAILPAYLFYVATDLPATPRLLGSFAMLLSAALYYGLDGMVSADGRHFVGFPVMWNMVVYLLIFVVPDLPWPLVFGAVLALAVLHFVPILVPYPSRGGRWWMLTIGVTLLFVLSAVLNVWYYPKPSHWWQGIALACSGYYCLITLLDTWAARRKA
ncbi:hypothetical protein QWY85_06715 [Neolewinella lacunae]|uniref:Phosphatidylcholine/phosphatidylserine synthase n=1 Tax=Neolewinella lacunae TaxID=1517758 RepID=A0A923PH39_9BACT|nr:phosphatidylcholine/phosphatidylserine synthase [Neolewinella lacunae]MBC6992601.1 phosphatidylcholine/phosphatidylserine synthase [Neolewinella lacunae]MDN3634342.1 hypothetical protein [Neolewinella lacunae]